MHQRGLTEDAKPLLKWAGGKTRLLSQLETLFPAGVKRDFDGRLVEPFTGGAAMFLWMRPKSALLADSNPELINLYRAVQQDPRRLISELDSYQELPHAAEVYYEQRADEPEDSFRAAARLVYLNKNCFNGLYRLNRSGKFNVPFGRYKTKPRLYELENILRVSELLQRAELRVQGFEETLRAVRPGDFVYLDPPYYPLSKTSSFTAYTGAGFNHRDQVELCEAIVDAHRRTNAGQLSVGRAGSPSAKMLLSNSSAPQLLEIYSNHKETFWAYPIVATRSVGAKQSSRGEVIEVAITNYIPGTQTSSLPHQVW